MAERTLPTALKTSLIANDPYTYFHLIKFEKPNGVTSSEFVSGKATDYAYITDSSINIEFDDDSKTSKGVANGDQIYVANKVLKVGTVNETTEAKASNMTLLLSGTAIGTIVNTNASFASSSMTTTTDLLEAGFQEGDVLLLESAGNTNNNKYARINKFTNANKTVSLTGIDCTLDNDATSRVYNLSYASEEISALLNNKEATNYTNYVNREVFVYRGHYHPDTVYAADGTTVVHTAGEIIGEPFLIFKGIISKGSVTDDVLKDSKVSWNLTSHWGDFVRVQGRLTSDYSHRALSVTGEADVGALVRPEYQYDLGFAHAERSINLIATYQTQETRYKMKKRGGLAGLIGMKKTVEYQVEVDREVDLQFNLSARSLPVVYGVQKVDSIPVFADINAGNVKDVYVAHAFAEGEIGGIFDIHVSDTSSVCLDANDKTNRTASDGVSIACYGRADKGFVLAGRSGRTSQNNVFNLTADERASSSETSAGGYETTYRQPQSGPSFNRDDTATGLQHETTFTLDHAETPTTLFIHTGKPDQDADDTLVGLASNKSFKLQNELSDINKNNYWSPNHRLLDTAYVVAKYTIGEGDTTIDKLEFVVSGKKVRSHNYDYSYDQDNVGTSSGPEFFNLADSVTIHRTHAEGSNAADSQIGSATIIDKWSFYRDSDTLLHRFRLSSNPQETANVTAFYIKRTVDGVVKKWYMVSHDHKVEATTLTAGTPVTGAILGQIPAHTTSNGMHARRVISLVASSALPIISQTQVGHFVSINVPSFGTPTALFKVVSIDTSNSTITVNDNNSSAMENVRDQVSHQQSTSGGGSILRNHNIVNLSSDGSSANDAYNGRAITFTRFDANDNITHQEEKEIVDYAVVSNLNLYLATLARPMPFDFNPGTDAGDSYTILSGKDQQDLRVSINPAIQLLDYLKNKRYGKGLEDKDINLPTFLQAARDCDTRSDVTIQTLGNLTDNTGSTKLVAGDVYKLKTTVAGEETRVHFQGTIKSVKANVVNIRTESNDVVTITPTTYTEVVFTDVIGKIAYKWNDWKIRANLDYFYYGGKLYQTTGGAVPNAPTSGHLSNDLNLTKVSGNAAAPTSLPMSINEGFTSSGNPIVKKFTNAAEGFNSPGYSLYDSDDVKYWKYLGWDDHEQRFVTRHQTNQIIDTSVPLFDNINSMLKQFNGVLRYSGGKYELAIKSASPSSFESFQTITDADIIGKIKLQDKGQKSTYNSMSANVIDPQNNYNARSISYFNSEYLKQDKGIRRSGQFAMPGISNYFNSRINIQQFLDESRYGLDISFTIDSKGYLLLTGEIIQITNERFNWSNKLFRIDNLNFQANGLVQVTATEHNDAAYLIGNIKTPYGTREIETEAAGSAVPTAVSTPNGITSLTATSGAKGAIDLAWANSTSFNTATHTTEVWASSTNDRTNATLIYTTQSAKMSDIVAEQTLVTKYYWVRHTVVAENGLVVPSAYFPASSTGGVQGTATGAIDGSDGTDGARGAGRWHIQVSSLPTTSSLANTRWGDGSGSQPSAAVVDDQAWFFTGTVSNPTAQKVWIYAGSGNWTEQVEVIDGDLIVNGTITADHISATSAKFKELVVDVGTFNTLNTTMLDAGSIVTRDIRVGPSLEITAGSFVAGTEYYITSLGTTTQAQWNTISGTSGQTYTIGDIFTASTTGAGSGNGKARNRSTVAKIAGSTLTGSGAHLNSDGDFYLGNQATNKYVFWDQSAGNLLIRGTIDAGTIKGGSIPDANAAPVSSEAGAFMDLTSGKVVFGNASKHILFDGTNLILSGVTIDANSIVNSTAGVIVKEDGTSEATAATTLNFTTGLNVAVTGSAPTQTATISLDSGYATESYVTTAIDNLVDGAPAALNTLNEIADAIADNDDFSGAMTTSLAGKLSLTGGALTGAVTTNSTFDGRNVSVDGGKLDGIAASANNYSHPAYSARSISTSGANVLGVFSSDSLGHVTNITTRALTLGDLTTDNTSNWDNAYANSITAAAISGTTTKTITLTQQDGGTITTSWSDVTGTDNYVDSLAFNTGNGILTVGRTGSLADLTVDLDGRYQTSAYSHPAHPGDDINIDTTALTGATVISDLDFNITTDTLGHVTDANATVATRNLTLADIGYTGASNANNYSLPTNNVTNASVSGNVLTLSRQSTSNITFTDNNTQYTAGDGLNLSSEEFTVDSTVVRTSGNQTIGGVKTFSGNATFNGTLQTADNKILINSDLTGTPSSSVTAGIEIERGNQSNKSFVYAENGVGPSNNLAGWTFGSEKVEAGTFYGTFVGDVTGTPSSLVGLTTDNLDEGTSNLYFTNARALAAITAGNGISKTGSTLDLDLSELTNMTATMSGTDEFIVMDNSAERKKAANTIGLSIFNNDSNFSSTTGTVTSVGITHGGNAFNTGSAITTSGNLAITMAGSSSQYVNGAGNLISFPSIPSAANNGVVTLAAGTDLHINETDKNFSMNQSNSQTITFDHNAISRSNTANSVSPGYGGTFTAIDSITTSAQGHVTAVNTRTVTIPASDTDSTNYFLNGITKSGNTLTFSVSGTTNQTYEFGSNAFNSTSFLTGNQTITLTGDASGSGTTSINVTVADDSHNHIISNVDGLQSALNGKQASGTYVTSVSGTAPVVSSGGTTPAISVTTAAVANGGASLATGNQIYDHVTTRISGLTSNAGTVTSVVAGQGLSGGTITSSGTIALSNNMNTVALSVDSLAANKIDVGVLDADSVISRDIRVGATGSEALVGNSTGAAAMTVGKTYIITSLGSTTNTVWSNMVGTPTNQFRSDGYSQGNYEEYSVGDIITISAANTSAGSGTGVEVSGEGSHLNQDGDFLVGKVSTKKLMYFDSGIGQLIMGEIKVKEINNMVLKEGFNQSAGLAINRNTTPRNKGVLVGYGANGQGYGNTSVGDSAGAGVGFGNTSYIQGGTASHNTCLGNEAGYNKISGTRNVFIGAFVARHGTSTDPTLSGSRNIGIGGHSDSGGGEVVNETTVFGKLTSGSNNISIGANSGCNLTTGSTNYFFGAGAGDNITTGSGNVIIGGWGGSAADANTITLATGAGSRRLYFSTSGNATFTGGINSASISSTGLISSASYVSAPNVAIVAGNNNGIGFWGGATGASGSYAIYMSAHNGTYGGRVTGETTSDYNMYFKMSAGTNRGFVFKNDTTNVAGIDGAGNGRFTGTINSGAITSTGNITAFSDERLKTEIQTLNGKKVLEMRGVEFIKDGVKGSGVIAQELEKVAPELVLDGEYKSVAYGNITGYLIEAIKEQQSEINELKDLVKQLLEK